MADSTPPAPHLLTLPLELRQQIYTHHYAQTKPTLTLHSTAAIGASMKFTQTATLKTSIDTSLLHVCRQIHAEAYPIFIASITLIITFDSALCSPSFRLTQPPLSQNIPKRVLDQLRTVVYCFPVVTSTSSAMHQRPSTEPFQFREVPSLTRFVFRKANMLDLEVLRPGVDAWSRDEGLVRAARRKALRSWIGGEVVAGDGKTQGGNVLGTLTLFGRGGWVSRLIDVKGNGVERERVMTELRVPRGCDLVVETDLMLVDKIGWRPKQLETMVLEVGVEDGMVRSRRFLDEEEMRERGGPGGLIGG